MLQTRIKVAAASLALSMVGMLGLVSSAQAAVYRGSWDPIYGTPFDSLGWKGSATYFLPDDCVGINGTCTDPDMAVLSATVQFYDIADPGQTVLQTLEFNPSVTIYGMDVSETQMTGVDTGFFNPVKGTTPIAQYMGNDYYFSLIFHEGQAQLFYTSDATTSPICAAGGFGGPILGVCGYSSQIPDVVYTAVPVPEASTWMLMAAGLGAVGFAARRRRS